MNTRERMLAVGVLIALVCAAGAIVYGAAWATYKF